MAVYSEVLDNQKILTMLKNRYKRVLIIGCGGCMNESLAFKNHLPIFKMDDSLNFIPFAVTQEMIRISIFLKLHEFEVNSFLINEGMPVLCIYSDQNDVFFFEDRNKPDVIVALCCAAGLVGLNAKFRSKIPVLHITKQLGQIAYSYKDLNGERIIVYNKSKAILLKS